MATILEIEFKGLRRGYFANPLEFPFEVGDTAVTQVEKGEDLGVVSHLGWRKGAEEGELPPFQVIRKASPEDLEILQRNREKESEAIHVARRKAAEHNLEMKFVDVELQWDGRKMTFFFTADGRIDFRELVKDFASTYRTRIDLRQIGARDETKKKGGYGVCGRILCCASWLPEFHPITTQMPRDQFLPLNPAKLSGVCGRLKCCLRYELEDYRNFLEHAPIPEQRILDPNKGEGIIEKLDMIRGQIHIRYRGGETEKFVLADFQTMTDWKPGQPKERCINIESRPEPVPEPEPVPTTAAPGKSLSQLIGDTEPPSKKDTREKSGAPQTPAKKGRRRPPRAKSAKPQDGESAKSASKSSRRHRRRPKKKKSSESKSPS
jgi:cell fate regulator YaaT (PSP1 superfamily)